MKGGMRRFPVRYTGRLKNSIKTKDNLLFKKNLITRLGERYAA